MKLTFLGATHEVTGSCSYLEIAGKHILIDYGMKQGVNYFENEEIPVPVGRIDYVLLTHAHIDHSGLLPLLYRGGFQGQVHCTTATARLCGIMLRDSAHIQEFEAEWRNRKNKRAGKDAHIPLYTMLDAEGVLQLFHGHPYQTRFPLCDGVEVCFIDGGHLLGSASIELYLTQDGASKKLVFSGDIGNLYQPLLNDPSYIEGADYVVMESTYGDRNHSERTDYPTELAAIIQKTFDQGGNLVIPSFAVGRTQELLYFIRQIKAARLVQGHGDFPVYVDSPLAVEATHIFNDTGPEYYDEEALALIRQGINPISFSNLRLSVSSDDSRAINNDPTPKVILSASGMCEAGRIRHHLKHNLWRPECTVLFVGYQAVGTLGRILLDNATEVKLFGETIEVHAEVLRLPGISGHADRDGLLRWIKSVQGKPRVFVNHGEDAICQLFTETLRTELSLDASAPYSGSVFDLAAGVWLDERAGRPIEKKSQAAAQASAVFGYLLAAANRLMALVKRSEGASNRDLKQMTRELGAFCDKWE